MHRRAIAVPAAALLALFLVAVPALADQEFVATTPSIDWRLVVLFTAIALAAFYYVLEGVNRGR